MRRQRFTTIAMLAIFGLFVTGCTSAALPMVARDNILIGDNVLAVRMSPQLNQINEGDNEGYLLLVDNEGHAKAVEVGAMDVGKLAWSTSGLYLSGPSDEYLLTNAGLTLRPRGSEEAYETSRFISPDGTGFIAVYNTGFTEDGYLHRVTAGDASNVETWDIDGLFGSIGQCGDIVVGITDLSDTSLATADSRGGFDALVQLYPKPENAEAGVLGTVPVVGTFEFEDVAPSAPCVDGVLYSAAFHFQTDDGSAPGTPVLRVWDSTTGQHSVLPLISKNGEILDVTLDDLSSNPGEIIDKTTYVWVDWCCDNSPARVFATDITTGVTTHRFDLALTSPEMGESQFVFTESSVFVLDVGQDLHAPLDFSRYSLATGKRTSLFSIPGTGSVHDGLGMVIRDMALAPDWLSANE